MKMSDEYGIPGHCSETILDAESLTVDVVSQRCDDEVFEVGQGNYVEMKRAPIFNPVSVEVQYAVGKELEKHSQTIDLLVGLHVDQSRTVKANAEGIEKMQELLLGSQLHQKKSSEINDSTRNDTAKCLKLYGATLTKHGEAINNLKAYADEKLNELNTRTDTVEKRMELWEKQYPLTVNAQEASGAVEEIPRLGDMHGVQAAIPIAPAPGTGVRLIISESDRMAGEERGIYVNHNQNYTRELGTPAGNNSKTVECQYCLKLFTNKAGMRRHVRYVCTSTPLEEQAPCRKVVCEHCQKSFAVSHLSRHVKSSCPMKNPRGPE